MSAALLVTHSADHYTVDRVADGLRRRGWRPWRFDTDLVPTAIAVEAWHGDAPRTVLHGPDGALDLAEVAAVWRRKQARAALPAELDPAWIDACRSEARALVEGALAALDGVRQINAPGADAQGENKRRQLAAAVAEGMEIPATLITNHPDAARAFLARHPRVVTKMQTPFSISMSGHTPFVYTSRVDPRDADELVAGLGVCPIVLQAEIPKACELRVAVVGDRCFPGAIRSAVGDDGPVDWRHPDAAHGAWEPGHLPAEDALRLCRIVRRLGLVYGAADVIRTPDGRTVFLEVNPAGEWGMLERDLGLPIGDALAAALTGASP